MGSSACLSLLIFGILLSCIEIQSELIASSDILTIVGGALCSLLFLLLMIFIGNVESFVVSHPVLGWPEVGVALFIACLVGSTVHGVCVTTCFLFSCGQLYYLVSVYSLLHPDQIKKQS